MMTVLDRDLHGEYIRRRDAGTDISGHMPALLAWAFTYPAARVVELGVRSGNSTAAFLYGLSGNPDSYLWSVDIEAPDVPRWWFRLESWSFLRADALGPAALAWGPPEIDVLFVDLDPHTAGQTEAVLRLWGPRVRPGGVILCHDTEFGPPVRDSMDPADVALHWRETGVSRGIQAWCDEAGLEWSNVTGSYGLGVIRVPLGDEERQGHRREAAVFEPAEVGAGQDAAGDEGGEDEEDQGEDQEQATLAQLVGG